MNQPIADVVERIRREPSVPLRVEGRVETLVGHAIEVVGVPAQLGSVLRVDRSPQSPALAEIVGFNGMRYSEANEEKMAKAYGEMIPGKTVNYTVNRMGHEKTLNVTLGKLPETVLAQWVGGHLLEAHAGTAQAQK